MDRRLSLGLVGMAVIFASLGLGEAVYRLLFFDFDGATDRLPIEMMFGLLFAGIVMKVVKKIYDHHMLTTAKISQISDRNLKIRSAVETIPPVPFPSHQQAIRVIRDEVDRIEWELAELRS
jgi:NADH:ubiquinone oxidoreductase subunit D